MTYLLYLVIRSLRREKKNDEKFKKELNRKFENILKRNEILKVNHVEKSGKYLTRKSSQSIVTFCDKRY